MLHVAKLFNNGRSQAVRLPAAFRFSAKEVFIRLDPVTQDVILSRKPDNWNGFFDAIYGLDASTDFLSAADRAQDSVLPLGALQTDPFAQWAE